MARSSCLGLAVQLDGDDPGSLQAWPGDRFTRPRLTAAYRDDDFEDIAIRDRLCGELTAWNYFAVPFYGNALARQSELVDQTREGQRFVEMAAIAIEGDRDHASVLSKPELIKAPAADCCSSPTG